MTFTELELWLMVGFVVLLWRLSHLRRDAEREERRANRYADYLVAVAKGQGAVVKKDGGWTFKAKSRFKDLTVLDGETK